MHVENVLLAASVEAKAATILKGERKQEIIAIGSTKMTCGNSNNGLFKILKNIKKDANMTKKESVRQKIR